MRRLPIALATLALVAAGCGGGETVSPLPETVEGKLATQAKGDPKAGENVYSQASPACGSCHTFTPAGSKAAVGPNLDELPELAERADQGSLVEFTRSSIVNPNQYVEEGFQPIMPAYGDQLSQKQIADLVAFLTQTTS